MYIKEVKINDAGTLLTGRATTSRKKTDFDKLDYKGYVTSNWNIKVLGKEAVKECLKWKKGDKIIVTKFTITNSEMYAEGKFSHPSIQILKWEYNDGAKQASSTNEQEPPDDDDVPF
jgi:hypothetical protein